MVEALVFDAAVKIVEKFTDLLKFRREQLREFFTTMLEPLFADLSVMHANYLKIFQECSAKLASHSVPFDEIVRDLAQQRVEYESLRIRVRAFVDELSLSDLPRPYKEFLEGVAFSVPDGGLTKVFVGSFATGIVKLLQDASGAEFNRLLSGAYGEPDARDERVKLLQSVEATSDFIKENWSQTCQKFSAAKAYSLK
jgi:hypothetical protein